MIYLDTFFHPQLPCPSEIVICMEDIVQKIRGDLGGVTLLQYMFSIVVVN